MSEERDVRRLELLRRTSKVCGALDFDLDLSDSGADEDRGGDRGTGLLRSSSGGVKDIKSVTSDVLGCTTDNFDDEGGKVNISLELT